MNREIAKLPPLTIKGMRIPVPIVQGGMGVGVSLSPLAGAVAAEGGLGIISSAALDRLVGKRLGRKMSTYQAMHEEVSRAKQAGGFAGVNIMVALQRDYLDSVRGAIDAGADAIISGAGLPLSLPALHPPKHAALVPIVSSARALELICKKWERLHYRPDAVVLEGPLAGGHLGFSMEQIDADAHRLEILLPPVKDMAAKYGGIPVIVAGGIFTGADIRRFIAQGADGVQMGTRFLATVESSATPAYKQAVVDARQEDIQVVQLPGSPCGLPFRIIRSSPMYRSTLEQNRGPKCDKGYVLRKDPEGRYSVCPAKEDCAGYFCICNGLLSSAGYNGEQEEPLYTVGTNAYRVDRVMAVRELMDELTGWDGEGAPAGGGEHAPL